GGRISGHLYCPATVRELARGGLSDYHSGQRCFLANEYQFEPPWASGASSSALRWPGIASQMRQLPLTAAEDLLEIIMRRYSNLSQAPASWLGRAIFHEPARDGSPPLYQCNGESRLAGPSNRPCDRTEYTAVQAAPLFRRVASDSGAP